MNAKGNFNVSVCLIVLLLWCVHGFSQTYKDIIKESGREGSELIGLKAPEWSETEWVNSEPLTLDALKGEVILIRWWVDMCPFCSKSSSALNEFHDKYKDKGLNVIGMYHPKPRNQTITKSYVQKSATDLEFEFPIAIDDNWDNLNKYWLNEVNRPYTSVSFLVDKAGYIRYIHPGPEYHKDGKGNHLRCKYDYRELNDMIIKLLKEDFD